MSTSDQSDEIRRTAKRSTPAVPPTLRRGSDKRVTRWIGAAHRKAALPDMAPMDAGPANELTPGQVIKLRWADTFGRPARPDLARPLHAAPNTAQVLPFRIREDRRTPADRGGDQPFVPVRR